MHRVDGNRAGVKGLIGIPALRYSLSMERIYYAGDQFLTGTDIARALVAYAAALAQQGSAGAIEIPVRHEENGRPGVVQLPRRAGEPARHRERRGRRLRRDPRRRSSSPDMQGLTAELAPMHPVASTSAPDRDDAVDYDWTDEV